MSASDITFDFSGRIAIVTGAGSGIGRAIALELARSGAGVVLGDLKQEVADKVVAEIEAAAAQVSAEDRAALELAAGRIEAYHARQVPEDAMWTDEAGARLGWRWTPVSSAGLYVPGGQASYPSSVLMNAIPARVAGVAAPTLAFARLDELGLVADGGEQAGGIQVR